jgi:hypothetical protein
MGFWDDLGKNALGVVKGAVKGASSYLEEIEKQAQERERAKQKEAEKENDALQELERQKQKILDEIADEKRKLEEERAKLAEQRSDPSYMSKLETKQHTQQEDEDEDEESSWEMESDDDSDDDIFGPEDEESQETKGDLYPGTAEEKHTLLEQLADMTAQQNELARRLKEAGLEKEVEDIVGKPSSDNSLYAVDTDDLGALSFSARSVTRQFRTALELMIKAMAASGEAREQLMEDAKSAIMGAEQAANDVEQLAAEMEKKAEEIQGRAAQPISIEESIKYDWKRKPIYISFGQPGDVFQRLDRIWNDISFGSKRDKDGNPIGYSRFSPYATARGGNDVSIGYRVPEYAYKTETAFINWCESVGLGEGVSLEVTSLMTKPGQRSMH